MSFILDALKKSETERQQQGGAEFATVPTSSPTSRPIRWLWLLGTLLAINLAVLVGILLRPDVQSTTRMTADKGTAALPADSPIAEDDATTAFAAQVTEAQQNLPPGAGPAVARPARATPAQSQPAMTTGRIRTIDELRLDGALQLPELHIDIHVYSDDPAERFVFINMAKHRENSQLAEGPVVAEITNDGVILEYQGLTFLLPRE